MKKAELVSYAKGIAILGIILFHLLSGYLKMFPIIVKASSFGGAGVHVFILCSGFGLMYSNLRKPLGFVDFIKKRFWKVYIPYIIVVILSFFLPIYSKVPNRIMALMSHVFLFKMFVPSLTATFGYQFWYISTIIQFYLVFTLLVKLYDKLGKRTFLIISCAASLCWATLVSILGFTEIRTWNSFFLQYLWEFALGMVLAREYYENGSLKLENISIFKLIIWIVVTFGIYSVLSLKGGFLKAFNDPFSLASFGGICLLLYKCKVLPKFVNFTSDISYEIYLVHVLIYKIILEALSLPIPLYVMMAIALVMAYLTAWLYSMFCKKLFSITKRAPQN